MYYPVKKMQYKFKFTTLHVLLPFAPFALLFFSNTCDSYLLLSCEICFYFSNRLQLLASIALSLPAALHVATIAFFNNELSWNPIHLLSPKRFLTPPVFFNSLLFINYFYLWMNATEMDMRRNKFREDRNS